MYHKISIIKVAWYVSLVKNMHFGVTLRPWSDFCHQGKAEIRILDFKTTWSKFQKASQTAAEGGNAELHILNFKTTWSEFQKPNQTAASRVEAELRVLDFKITYTILNKITSPESVPSSCVRQHP